MLVKPFENVIENPIRGFYLYVLFDVCCIEWPKRPDNREKK